MVGISNGTISAVVNLFGAELCSLKTAAGTELLWQPDPAVWVQQSPILFPTWTLVQAGSAVCLH